MPELASQLTVVLLTYQCAHRVEAVLTLLMRLDVPIIAVDNASTDGTADLIAAAGVPVVRERRNIGAAARNTGAALARTPYVAFCDDDGWYEARGLETAVATLDAYPRLALVNARILVGDDEYLDPISLEMAASPLPDRHGVPGHVVLSFMAGAVVVRRRAYLEVGGFDRRFFIGGEEETLAVKLARDGWQMRYRPEVVMHHRPSLANAPHLRAFGMRNTLWNCWLHRRFVSALRWSWFTLTDTPKNRDWVRGFVMTVSGLPWVLRERRPMAPELDAAYRELDARRFARRRPVLARHEDFLTCR